MKGNLGTSADTAVCTDHRALKTLGMNPAECVAVGRQTEKVLIQDCEWKESGLRMSGQSEQTVADLLTFEQAAVWLGLDKLGCAMSGKAVYNLCRNRQLRHVKIGKRVFVRVAHVYTSADERPGRKPSRECEVNPTRLVDFVNCVHSVYVVWG